MGVVIPYLDALNWFLGFWLSIPLPITRFIVSALTFLLASAIVSKLIG